jgi:hypothetical protein
MASLDWETRRVAGFGSKAEERCLSSGSRSLGCSIVRLLNVVSNVSYIYIVLAQHCSLNATDPPEKARWCESYSLVYCGRYSGTWTPRAHDFVFWAFITLRA